MKLVIAEKPSVGQSLAKVLGAVKRNDGFLEGNGYIVSWCLGHLVELAPPESYDEKLAKWEYEDLPILPDKWKYEVSNSTKKQFKIIKNLINRDDVESLVCATDAGREGELIFRLVYKTCGCKKPFERLWISSMEDSAIRDGFNNLRPGNEFDSIYEAALCRERADWIVGINATRLFSCLYNQTLNVGRVMTPTLGMVVMRDAEIMAFVPESFYTVQILADGITVTSKRFKEKESAEELLDKCVNEGSVVIESVDRQEKREKPPLLYDLTTLQRDANRILGYTAQQTVDYVQSLYEKKLVTYPRTDSQYLPDDMVDIVPGLVNNVSERFEIKDLNIAQPKRIVNSKKVSDHYALIPTETFLDADTSNLPSGEQEILQLICVRLMCAVGEDHIFTESSLIVTCAGEEFTSKSKEVLSNGWKQIWQKFYPTKESNKEVHDLSSIEKGKRIKISDIEVKEGKTTNKKHYTEDTLLSAMESAGSEDMPKDAERKGIGTPATRAGIIEKLIQKGFLERKGDNRKRCYLTATNKGTALITVMPEEIQSPSMTAEWEQKLLDIEHGEYSSKEFMNEICNMISDLVKNYEAVKGAKTMLSNEKVIGKCPSCGSEVIEKQKGWFCSNKNCKFAIWKDHAYFNSLGKRMTPSIAEHLVKEGRSSLKNCKSRKTGKTYDADVVMTVDDSGKPLFNLEFKNNNKSVNKI